MNLNKCSRCGSFFMASGSVCPNCETKDQEDINKLKNFFEDNSTNIALDMLAIETGVSEKNFSRLYAENAKNEYFANYNLEAGILKYEPKISL